MAASLLLYFHIARENGITNDQTIYLDSFDLNPFDLINIEFDKEILVDIDQDLVQKGAIISLICDLDDLISNYEDDFKSQEQFNKLYNALFSVKDKVPGLRKLLSILWLDENNFDYSTYKQVLNEIVQKEVFSKFTELGLQK